ncbi:hypothetical protein QJS04_geneDACA012709 [Acorus gramineus]|uniref:Uncharacterized protein n=1 Tax=Acorus gramineus TaxID=55184 RepID=A0AAV9B6H0_ACOGR|nr:hypothetical protein QJS04_geneDACA012709 [Acorus gramineus]
MKSNVARPTQPNVCRAKIDIGVVNHVRLAPVVYYEGRSTNSPSNWGACKGAIKTLDEQTLYKKKKNSMT